MKRKTSAYPLRLPVSLKAGFSTRSNPLRRRRA